MVRAEDGRDLVQSSGFTKWETAHGWATQPAKAIWLEVTGEPEIHPGGPFKSVPGFHGPYAMTFWGKMDMCVPGYLKTQHQVHYPHML